MNDSSKRPELSLRSKYRGFVDRYERIQALELEESRQRSPSERYRHFLDLLHFAIRMNWRTSTPVEDAEVARRWRVIRDAHRG